MAEREISEEMLLDLIETGEKLIAREVSQDWNVNVSFAADGSVVELVILDAVKAGFMPFGSGQCGRAAAA